LELTKEPASRLVYTFGPFLLDPAERRLIRAGRDLRLPPKVFETLAVLVERHGLLVEKDDLMKALWPGIFVEEVTLAGNISQLRKALGDAPGQDESHYIETVSRRGYRFTAKVTEVSQPIESSGGLEEAGVPSTASEPPQLTQLVDSSAARERIAWATATVILLSALLAMGIRYIRKPVPQTAVVRSRIPPPADTQFSAFDNERWLPAVSPDGSHIVSPVWDSRGTRLWLRTLNDTGDGRALPSTENAGFPFWSPDSRSIGFFADGKLKRIDIEGKVVQVLCDVPIPRGGAWSRDGVILFERTQYSALYQVPASGGTVRQVTELNASRGEQSHRWPVFLADGRHFVFFVRSEEHPEEAGIYAGSLDSKDYHLVVRATTGPAYEARGTLVYVRDGVMMVQGFDEKKLAAVGEPIALPDRVAFNPLNSSALFSVSPSGVMVYYPAVPAGPFNITWYNHDGKRGDSIDSGYFYGFDLSPDETQAVLGIINADGLSTDLWSLDLIRGTKTRLTSGPMFKALPVWQPDGRFVLFSAGFTGSPTHIDRIKSDGTGTSEPLLKAEDFLYPGSVCPNGNYLAFTRRPNPGGAANIGGAVWILPLTGDRQPFPLIRTQFVNALPAFSPDCKWVAYVSNETGQNEVYVTHFPDVTRRYRVSTQGGTMPQWRGDGRELFYFSAKKNSVLAVNVDEKADSISLGSPHTLFSVYNYGSPFTFYDVTADGRRFLITEANSTNGPVPLTLVTNWSAEVKKK
jgi:DNA-binding winged helix-turn-helix (wHTH) protein/Tol biopolymer transport system component